jgi:hypothetical protein
MPHKTTIQKSLFKKPVLVLDLHARAQVFSRSVLCKDITRSHKAIYAYTKKATYNNVCFSIKNYHRLQLAFTPPQRDITRRRAGNRRHDSISRTRQNVFFIVGGNIQPNYQPMFITLTFARNECDLHSANREFRNFVRRFERYLRRKIKYLVVPEFQKRGAVHFHCVVFNVGYYPVLQLKKIWGLGSVDIKKIDHPDNVAAYISGYITKELFDNRLFGQKAFFTSRGLLRPIVERDNARIEVALENFLTNVPQNYKVVSEVVITPKTSITTYKYIHYANNYNTSKIRRISQRKEQGGTRIRDGGIVRRSEVLYVYPPSR